MSCEHVAAKLPLAPAVGASCRSDRLTDHDSNSSSSSSSSNQPNAEGVYTMTRVKLQVSLHQPNTTLVQEGLISHVHRLFRSFDALLLLLCTKTTNSVFAHEGTDDIDWWLHV
jgi:hypothetical protein